MRRKIGRDIDWSYIQSLIKGGFLPVTTYDHDGRVIKVAFELPPIKETKSTRGLMGFSVFFTAKDWTSRALKAMSSIKGGQL